MRAALALVVGALLTAGCAGTPPGTDPPSSPTVSSEPSPPGPFCPATPSAPADGYLGGMPARTDLRRSQHGTVAGQRLDLRLEIVQPIPDDCVPIVGATVEVWHAAPNGSYSPAAHGPLRGSGTTDAEGAVAWTSLFPGWDTGRAPHIHVRVTLDGHAFATQVFLPESRTLIVQGRDAYVGSAEPTSHDADPVFTEDSVVFDIDGEETWSASAVVSIGSWDT